MAKVKKDWAREIALRFVRNDINASVFITNADVEHEVKRLATLFRRTFERGYQQRWHSNCEECIKINPTAATYIADVIVTGDPGKEKEECS